MSMARLYRDQGKRDEARELLSPVYGWFTEGFDTLDLKEAKALLSWPLESTERSFFRHARFAQALEEPLVVCHPCRIVGQRQLLLSQLADRCGGDAGHR